MTARLKNALLGSVDREFRPTKPLGELWGMFCFLFRPTTAGLCCAILANGIAGAEEGSPPWPPTYKIKPHETERLTAADVVGPDGIVYPDWRYAGVPGGIPRVPVAAPLAEFGGRPDDDRCDSAALAAGVAAVASTGGGALLLDAGVYHLDRPVVIPCDGIVIRGQGPDKTRLVFRYAPPKDDVVFFAPAEGETVGADSLVEIHAFPDDLQKIALSCDGKQMAVRERYQHWGGTFCLKASARTLLSRVGPGKRKLTASAEWKNGRRAQQTVEVELAKHMPPVERRPGQHSIQGKGAAALEFVGDAPDGSRWLLATDGRRGDMVLQLTTPPHLSAGDRIVLEAPATERWNRLVRNACQWGTYRRYEFRVDQVDGRQLRLNQPLRIDFPTVDGSYVRRINPIRRCGVEDLALEQTQKLWTCGVLFTYAWECWARNLKVVKAGQHAVYSRQAKWCEIRDCQFDDAWYHGGGGTAYVGWEKSYDCLMENVTTHRMRHAPCVQWSSSGNVIRRCTFHGSDAQWHAGWTSENLYEQCFVDANGSNGSYGHGGWASPPQDKAHGPEGPRNVIYNCDFRARKTGLWLGGMNENWLILHNRFIVEKGAGISARICSFDHLILNNTFALKRKTMPAIQLDTADCTGIEIVGNRVYGGNGKLVAGEGRPLVNRENTIEPLVSEPPRPVPRVPSIFEWQRQH